MKNNKLYKFLFALAMLVGIVSCDDREHVVIEPTGDPIVMSLSENSLFLDSNYPNNPALTVIWDAASYSIPTEIKYEVEVSKSEEFKQDEVYKLGTFLESINYATFTASQMNNAAAKIGLEANVVGIMYFRVKAIVGNLEYLNQTSNVTSLEITPYLAGPTYDYIDLYLIGDATAGGWDNSPSNNSLYPLSKTSEASKYTYTGYFKVGGFKIIKDKGSWDAQYGLGAAFGQLDTSGGSGDIKVEAAGYYKLSIDIESLTFTLEPIQEPTVTYNEISIIGSVIGNWDTDIPLKKSSFDPHVWTINNVTLNSGEFKFRVDKDWAISWGASTEFFGVATKDGANIPLVETWTYDVYFNDATGQYTIIPKL